MKALRLTIQIGVPVLILLFLLLYSQSIFRSFPLWMTQQYENTFKEQLTTSNSVSQTTGQIGDTYGGTLGPLIAIFAAFLTFLAFWVQYWANEQQRIYLRRQSFEDTFFRLLENHQKIVDAIDIKKKEDNTTLSKSRDCFRTMYNEFKKENAGQLDVAEINNAYDKIQDKYKSDLHHYFSFLYHILKYIKNADIDLKEKFRYASILRATLSPYELIFIFYNGLHEFGISHFKPLLEEFSFLKNMDESLLISDSQKALYDDLTFAPSNERGKLFLTWKEKQKKSRRRIGVNFWFEY